MATDHMTSTVQIHHCVADLPEDVSQVMAGHALHSLQLGLPWMNNLERTVFDQHDGLRYFVLRDSGRILAVLPTLAEPGGWGRRVLALGNYYTAIYAPFLADGLAPEALAPLIDAMRRHHAPLASLNLAPMDPQGKAYRLLQAALQMHGMAAFGYYCFGNWHLEAPGNWAAFLASRDSKQRSNIKRMAQRLADGHGHVEIITQPADLARGLAAYDRVYAKSWKIPEPYPRFMPGLAALCAQAGALRLGVVWLQDTPIAAQLWMVTGGRAEIYKVAYDEAYKALSPGTVLTAALLQHVIEHDHVSEVDYLIGDDPYKRNWMNARRERWGLIAYDKRTWPGRAGWLREALGRWVKTGLQRWQALLQPRWEQLEPPPR
jgi:hypothetical protein